MGPSRVLTDAGTIVALAAFWTSALFPVITAWFWAWWRQPFGRVTVSIDVLLALALLPGLLRRLFGVPITSVGFGWFTVAVIALIPVRTVWLVRVIWRLQRQPEKEAP